MPAPDPSSARDTSEAPNPATPVPPHGTWSGRFGEPMSERMQRFTASVDFDRRLARADISGSLAHARMLAARGILTADDLAAIERGLTIDRSAKSRAANSRGQRALEDVHFNIERRLTALVGDAGKRLHTARSRNDQVATDMRLWLRDAIDASCVHLTAMRRALQDLAERHADDDHARLHAPAGRAAGHVRPSPAGVRRDARARRRALRATAGDASTACRSAAPRSPAPAIRSTASRSRASSASIASATNSLDAVSDRDFAIEFECGGRARHGAPVAVRRRARAVVEPALRFRDARRSLLHRQLDHAAEEEPRRAGARARQVRRASSGT